MMKARLEVCDASQFLDSLVLDVFLSTISPVRKTRIMEGKNQNLHAQRAAQERALMLALRHVDEDYSTLEISYTDKGKPFIVGRPDLAISFSRTHFLGSAYVVKSNGNPIRCGMDIERVVPLEEKHIKLHERFLEGDLPTKPEDFFSHWTKMECLVKLTGEGIGGAKHLPDSDGITLTHKRFYLQNGDLYLVYMAYEDGLAFSSHL